jgi:GDPmannose 4,6-dehydratase
MPTALIIGAASQDGSYLSELLLSKEYQVIGTIRQQGDDLSFLARDIILEHADLSEYSSLEILVKKYHPDEIYNLASMSVPSESWEKAALVGQITGIAPVYILEAIRRYSPKSKFFQAGSREILQPENPYAAAKLYAHTMVKIYRESLGLFAVSGILYNHESPRRPTAFVTRKITAAAASIKNHVRSDVLTSDGKLELWDLASPRDRGFAGDFVKAFWLMLRNEKPKDYQIATGEIHTIQDVCVAAFDAVGLNWRDYVVVKASDTPTNSSLPGDYSQIKKDLGWQPETSFKELIEMMVSSDLKTFR